MGRRGRLPASCLSGCKAGRCGVPGSQCWLLREESSLILLHFVQLLGQAFLFGWTFSCLLASCPGWSCYFCCSSEFEVAAAATTTTTCIAAATRFALQRQRSRPTAVELLLIGLFLCLYSLSLYILVGRAKNARPQIILFAPSTFLRPHRFCALTVFASTYNLNGRTINRRKRLGGYQLRLFP